MRYLDFDPLTCNQSFTGGEKKGEKNPTQNIELCLCSGSNLRAFASLSDVALTTSTFYREQAARKPILCSLVINPLTFTSDCLADILIRELVIVTQHFLQVPVCRGELLLQAGVNTGERDRGPVAELFTPAFFLGVLWLLLLWLDYYEQGAETCLSMSFLKLLTAYFAVEL